MIGILFTIIPFICLGAIVILFILDLRLIVKMRKRRNEREADEIMNRLKGIRTGFGDYPGP